MAGTHFARHHAQGSRHGARGGVASRGEGGGKGPRARPPGKRSSRGVSPLRVRKRLPPPLPPVGGGAAPRSSLGVVVPGGGRHCAPASPAQSTAAAAARRRRGVFLGERRGCLFCFSQAGTAMSPSSSCRPRYPGVGPDSGIATGTPSSRPPAPRGTAGTVTSRVCLFLSHVKAERSLVCCSPAFRYFQVDGRVF